MKVLTEKLAAAKQEELYYDLEVPLCLILARMEHEGIAVDGEHLQELSNDYAAKIDEEIAAARELAGIPR